MSSSRRLTDLLPPSESTSLLHAHKFASPPHFRPFFLFSQYNHTQLKSSQTTTATQYLTRSHQRTTYHRHLLEPFRQVSIYQHFRGTSKPRTTYPESNIAWTLLSVFFSVISRLQRTNHIRIPVSTFPGGNDCSSFTPGLLTSNDVSPPERPPISQVY